MGMEYIEADDNEAPAVSLVTIKVINPPATIIYVIPTAFVTKLPGTQNLLTILLNVRYANGASVTFEQSFLIDNNSAGAFQVEGYRVFVDTKANTQIRACYMLGEN